MKTAWRTLVGAGSFSLAALAAVGAVADDPPTDEPPVQAPKPSDVEPLRRNYGPVAGPVAAAPVMGVAAPTVVGDYIVGHVHDAPLSHILWYSAYHPFVDELHAPMRATVYGGAHARYYAGYRTIHNTPLWSNWYVPQAQCYAPGAYGYQGHHPQVAAPVGGPQTAFYGPGYYGALHPGSAGYPAAPPAGFNANGFRYTGEPGVFSPYGVGSSSYFGAYGSAGY